MDSEKLINSFEMKEKGISHLVMYGTWNAASNLDSTTSTTKKWIFLLFIMNLWILNLQYLTSNSKPATSNTQWQRYFFFFLFSKSGLEFEFSDLNLGQPTVPPQTDSTHARSYTTYSTHNSSFTGLLLHKRGPTRSCIVWHRQPIQHAAFLHMLRYSTRRYCTAPNSPQTDFSPPRFNTTRFYTSVFLHEAGPAPPFPVSADEYISSR